MPGYVRERREIGRATGLVADVECERVGDRREVGNRYKYGFPLAGAGGYDASMQQLLRRRMEDSFATPGHAQDLERLLTEGRSCVVEVINETPQTMRRVFVAALHGVFVTQPAALVPPDSRDRFGMQNRPEGIGVGCEGVVRYALGETLVELHFDNPFAGRNFAGAQFSGRSMLDYSCDAHAEEGDARVRVRFVLRRRIEGST